MRSLNALQLQLLGSRDTMPIYLVVLGTERLSTNGDRAVGGYVYTSGASVAGLDNWTEARIKLAPSLVRIEQAVSMDLIGLGCSVSLLPAVRYPVLVEDYWEDGYALQGLVMADPIVLLDGIITDLSEAGPDAVIYTVQHRIRAGRWAPGLRISPPLCNHLPAPGTVITWEGEKYVLEAG